MIQDGKNIEVQSIPLDRMEVAVATQADLNALSVFVDSIDARVTVLEGREYQDFLDHLVEPIATAHSGQIDVAGQIPDYGIGTDKVSFTVLTLGYSSTQAAPGDHGHTASDIGDFDPSDYVRKTGSIDESVTGIKTFEHNVVVQGNLTVNGTTTTVNSDNLTVVDNEIVLNKDELGAGITAGVAGLRFERGTEVDYLVQFTEADDKLKAGFIGDLHNIAFIEDVNNAVSGSEANIDGGVGTFKSDTTHAAITMSKDLGTNYEVTITPKLATAGDVSNIGAYYWVRVSNTQFNVYNTGNDAVTEFSWIARKN